MTEAPSTPPTPWRRRPRRRRGAGPWVALALVALGLAVILARRTLAEWILLAELRRLGVPEASLSVAVVGAGRLELRQVEIGREADLAIDLLEARVTPGSLRSGRLAALRARGVRLRGAYTDQGLSFGALDALFGADEPGAPTPLALPAASVEIEDARLGLETKRGALLASFSARAKQREGAALEAHAELEAQHPLFTAKGSIDATGTYQDLAGSLALDLTADGELAPGYIASGVKIALEVQLRSREGALELVATLPAFPLEVLLRRAAGDELLVRGESPALRLAATGPLDPSRLSLHVDSAGGRLELREYALEVRDVVASLDLATPALLPVGTVSAGRILDLARPERFAPLALRGALRAESEALGFDLTLAGADGALAVDAQGRHDPRNGAGEARVRVAPVVFQPEGLQPATLLPILGDRIAEATGTLEALGELAWQGGAAQGSLDLALRELSLSSELADVERVNAAIQLGWPLSTPPAQILSLARLDCGLELTDGLVEFELRPGGVLALSSAALHLAGGRIHTAGEIDPKADEQGLVLEVEDLQLGELFELVDLEGLSGEGVLAGEIPVVVRGETIEIREAFLASSGEGGWIRYRPEAGAPGLAANPGMVIALRALENFSYEKLEIRVDGEAAGAVRVAAALRGSNPDLEGGRPVEFNLNLEGELGDLVGAGATAYQIPENVERRLREFSERSR